MMSRLLYIVLKCIALLPLGVLYLLSDAIFAVIYHLVGYRRAIVRQNLAVSFPEMDKEELRSVERQFYRNFADNIVETIKLLHISDKEMMRRMEFADTEIIDELLEEGRSIVVYFAHTFNWEWAPSVTLHLAPHIPAPVCAQIYRPLRSKAVDAIMLRLRSRFGSESIPKAAALRHLLQYRREGLQSVTGFMSDQHPSHGDPGLVTDFLNHPTAMITGTETLARRLGMAVVYWDMERRGRGRFRITVRRVADDPSALPEGAITLAYTRLLEDTVRRDPANWLWSHNRWKHPVVTTNHPTEQ